MTIGTSGTFAINGTDLPILPTTSGWVQRDSLGFTGDGHPDYVGVREYRMEWQLISMTEAAQLQGFFDTLGVTGTASVDLPKYNTAPYQYYTYSGTTLSEPQMDIFFEQHEVSVSLLIYGIVTS